MWTCTSTYIGISDECVSKMFRFERMYPNKIFIRICIICINILGILYVDWNFQGIHKIQDMHCWNILEERETEKQRERNRVRETERKREREIDEKEREINGKLSFECTSPFRCWIVSYLITRLCLINYIFYYLFIWFLLIQLLGLRMQTAYLQGLS